MHQNYTANLKDFREIQNATTDNDNQCATVKLYITGQQEVYIQPLTMNLSNDW
jgi:hypothetical protein